MRFVLLVALTILPARAQTNALDFLNHNRSVLDAHNCYPQDGRWSDRIDRALQIGFPAGIEQDLAWYVDPATGQGRVVVAHEARTTGSEPLLRDYFFERVRPIVEKALAENDRARWPLIVLHFDFKDNQIPLLHAVWNLLGEYQAWITTAAKTDGQRVPAPLDAKPLLVLTEDSDLQEQVFFDEVPSGGRLRLFGSAHTRPIAGTKEQKDHLLATVPPDRLLDEPPTNYRRWWNNSWLVVEEGGQRQAGDWTAAKERRLRALVDHAHRLGYWIRFYTLDGFAPAEDRGWGQDYNFGSRDAAVERWEAALRAGVNLIATDQYEDLGGVMWQQARPGKGRHYH